MRIFIDECIDWRLTRDLIGHDIKTARQMDWVGVKNGILLGMVAGRFDVFVTVDRNLSFQNVVAKLPFAVVVLQAKSNRLADLRPLVPELMRVLPLLKAGELSLMGDK